MRACLAAKQKLLYFKAENLVGASIKIGDLRALQNNDLEQRLRSLILELNIEHRKVISTGVASKTVKIREMRHTIARIYTILNERRRGAVS